MSTKSLTKTEPVNIKAQTLPLSPHSVQCHLLPQPMKLRPIVTQSQKSQTAPANPSILTQSNYAIKPWDDDERSLIQALNRKTPKKLRKPQTQVFPCSSSTELNVGDSNPILSSTSMHTFEYGDNNSLEPEHESFEHYLTSNEDSTGAISQILTQYCGIEPKDSDNQYLITSESLSDCSIGEHLEDIHTNIESSTPLPQLLHVGGSKTGPAGFNRPKNSKKGGIIYLGRPHSAHNCAINSTLIGTEDPQESARGQKDQKESNSSKISLSSHSVLKPLTTSLSASHIPLCASQQIPRNMANKEPETNKKHSIAQIRAARFTPRPSTAHTKVSGKIPEVAHDKLAQSHLLNENDFKSQVSQCAENHLFLAKAMPVYGAKSVTIPRKVRKKKFKKRPK